MEVERKREKEVQTVETDQGKHTQEMLAPAARLNCLILQGAVLGTTQQ